MSNPDPKTSAALTALAKLYRGWSELCRRKLDAELSPEMRWLLKGMAIAHGMDADRASTLAKGGKMRNPPDGDPLGAIHRGLLELLEYGKEEG